MKANTMKSNMIKNKTHNKSKPTLVSSLIPLFISLSFLSLSILISPCVNAETIPDAKSYTINIYISSGKVLTESSIRFTSPATGNIEITLPLDARAIAAKTDNKTAEITLNSNKLTIPLNKTTQVNLQYISESFLESNSFIANLRMPIDADIVSIRMSLPENAVLEKGLEDEDIASPSVFPKPTLLQTNGKVIDIIWQIDDMKKDDEYPLLVHYVIPGNKAVKAVYALATILVLTLAMLAYILMRAKQRKQQRKQQKKETETQHSRDHTDKTRKHIAAKRNHADKTKQKNLKAGNATKETSTKNFYDKEDYDEEDHDKEEDQKAEIESPKKAPSVWNIENHLKEDEEQVVNILKQREGNCEQGTLRVITGFSKAKLSGLLMELEARKIVHKEKRGKKNLVFLKNQ
jgi:uncharacterized membrane protein